MAAYFFTSTQCQIPCCYTCGLVSAGATQGELPKGAREGPLGDNSVAQLVCALLCTAPANISLQTRFILQTLHSNSQFSIFNSPFCTRPIQTNSKKRAVSRPRFCIPKHQHAPFSEQNLTSLPSRIIFVVRTAHILPHIEQV